MSGTYEVFRDAEDEWRWRLRAKNGEIVAQSEGYPSKSNAERGARDARAAARWAIVEVADEEPT